jgi:uncharacterized protein (DUF433 family)
MPPVPTEGRGLIRETHRVECHPIRTLDQHIEVTPGITGGTPRIAGHRITVQDIAICHERLGRSPDQIAAEYALTLADVYAALA